MEHRWIDGDVSGGVFGASSERAESERGEVHFRRLRGLSVGYQTHALSVHGRLVSVIAPSPSSVVGIQA